MNANQNTIMEQHARTVGIWIAAITGAISVFQVTVSFPIEREKLKTDFKNITIKLDDHIEWAKSREGLSQADHDILIEVRQKQIMGLARQQEMAASIASLIEDVKRWHAPAQTRGTQ